MTTGLSPPAPTSAALRARLSELKVGRAGSKQVDVIITHIEVNDRHGVGVLTKMLFGGHPDVLSIRSFDHFGGEQQFGIPLRLCHQGPRTSVYSAVLRELADFSVRRIVCIPYFPNDVRTGIALKDVTGVRLCTYLMDDQNIHSNGIPDDLMRELLAKSDLRLAISGELRGAYERKYGLRFWALPPLVKPALISSRPFTPSKSALASRRGIMVGNIWSARWLELLRGAMRGTGLTLDWYSNNGSRYFQTEVSELAADGISVCGAASDAVLVAALRAHAFAIVPTGTLDAEDDRQFIARLSLPSRMPYILATSNTPMIVAGDERAAASRFVLQTGTGAVAAYDPDALQSAIQVVTRPEVQERLRRNAARISTCFSSLGARQWIWDSLEAGKAKDDRFERSLYSGRALLLH